jgi:hypothetical protein
MEIPLCVMSLTRCIDMAILVNAMSPKTPTALRLDSDVLAAMRALKVRDGVPMTIQIEKAVTEWLAKRGIVVKAARPRTRKGGT